MSHRQVALISSLLICVFLTAGRLEASHRVKSSKAQVKFVAASWFLRGTWGMNEDKYLVEMHLGRTGPSFLAHLVDKYPNDSAPIGSEELRSEVGTSFRVSRDASCDIQFGQLTLRTAPDDPMAILLEPLGYQPILKQRPEAAAILPCYRVSRR